MIAPSPDDSDAFVAAFLARRLADRQTGTERSLDDYCGLFPGRESLVRRAWAECNGDAGAAPRDAERAAAAIGPYHLLHRLGQGGQGEVWLGEDPRLGRRVAIKILRGVAFASADALVRFRREAEVAARLAHPGICPVYDAGFDAGVPYLVMRHLEGEPLAATLPALVPQPGPDARRMAERVARILEQLARALHAAHEAAVLHRDVKPQNVMLTRDDVPVLLDFGLARLVDDATLFTRTGDRLGTPAYVAPEQLGDPPAPPSRAMDVYGLGVVLHECLTGRRPFDGPTLDSLYRRILAGTTPTAQTSNPAVPADLSVIAATAMERDPRRRYATAGAMADDLRRWLERRPVLARPAGPLLRASRWVQRSPALAFTLFALLITLAIGLAVSLALGHRAASLLGEWERLADRRRLDDLVHEADADLWPAIPARLPAMRAWLARAEPLAARLTEHRDALAQLRSGDDTDEGKEERQWREHQLEELVRGLEAFTADDPFATTITSVRQRRERAEQVEARTVVAHASAWQAAAARVAHDERFRGIALAPQLGLVPIGADPVSHLEEFADASTGDVPERRADGTLGRGERTAVVFVLLPPGSFLMGAQKADANAPGYDPDALLVEGPPHEVTLAAFLLSKFELTQAQWRLAMGDNPSRSQAGRVVRGVAIDGRHPVENVSWLRCETLAFQRGWTLPTEAQWEYACRAGTTTPWSTGAEAASLFGAANLADGASRRDYPSDWQCHEGVDDGNSVHAPVGSYRGNAFGLFDMHGNVREWCHDAMLRYATPVQPGTGERMSAAGGAAPAKLRCNRGGSCVVMATDLRSARRGEDQVGMQTPNLGVRPARQLDR